MISVKTGGCMGRYYYSSKDTVEDTRKIDINWLMRVGEYEDNCSYYNRTITWTTSGGWGETKNSINYDIDLEESSGLKMRLSYVCTDAYSEEKKSFNYEVRLTTTKCYFGGHRHWFICPNTSCGKRVGCLYFGQKYFLCRHCLDLSYEGRNESKRYRAFGRLFDYEEKAEKLADEIWGKHGRRYYAGKPTKKYGKYLNLSSYSNLYLPQALHNIS
ncbi:MAG: hypothetical protein HN981_02140 [Candidatus Pacebacteria bacterium]|jgi:hypothetical protein|nr:hypothetical protein [Candidatus Paceibacterota bacterium]MBT6921172.1 hypothetical protein [Candidatus Paceibacterota bacterium]